MVTRNIVAVHNQRLEGGNPTSPSLRRGLPLWCSPNAGPGAPKRSDGGTPLSDSEMRRVSQTNGRQKLTVRRLTTSRAPYPMFAGLYRPTGFGSFVVLDL